MYTVGTTGWPPKQAINKAIEVGKPPMISNWLLPSNPTPPDTPVKRIETTMMIIAAAPMANTYDNTPKSVNKAEGKITRAVTTTENSSPPSLNPPRFMTKLGNNLCRVSPSMINNPTATR